MSDEGEDKPENEAAEGNEPVAEQAAKSDPEPESGEEGSKEGSKEESDVAGDKAETEAEAKPENEDGEVAKGEGEKEGKTKEGEAKKGKGEEEEAEPKEPVDIFEDIPEEATAEELHKQREKYLRQINMYATNHIKKLEQELPKLRDTLKLECLSLLMPTHNLSGMTTEKHFKAFKKEIHHSTPDVPASESEKAEEGEKPKEEKPQEEKKEAPKEPEKEPQKEPAE